MISTDGTLLPVSDRLHASGSETDAVIKENHEITIDHVFIFLALRGLNSFDLKQRHSVHELPQVFLVILLFLDELRVSAIPSTFESVLFLPLLFLVSRAVVLEVGINVVPLTVFNWVLLHCTWLGFCSRFVERALFVNFHDFSFISPLRHQKSMDIIYDILVNLVIHL